MFINSTVVAFRSRFLASAVLCCAAFSAQAQTAATPEAAPAAPDAPAAEGPAPISIELNKLEPQQGACRAYMVLSNPGGPDITDLKLDLILFNQDQIIERRIAVGLSPLPAGKTTVKLFDIDGQDCTRIGSVLINEVMACTGASGAVADCATRITPTSRVNAKFFK